MTTGIIITFRLEGFHNWPAAKEIFPEVGFLSDRHRHIFHFELHKEVTHDDRDIEIILFKRKVINWLNLMYNKEPNTLSAPCEFGSMSCEMIAKKLLREFGCGFVKVLEDGENGAYVTR